jgi:hypothetical protein
MSARQFSYQYTEIDKSVLDAHLTFSISNADRELNRPFTISPCAGLRLVPPGMSTRILYHNILISSAEPLECA